MACREGSWISENSSAWRSQWPEALLGGDRRTCRLQSFGYKLNFKIQGHSTILFLYNYLDIRKWILITQHDLPLLVRNIPLDEALVDQVGHDALDLIDVKCVTRAKLPVESVDEVLGVDD